MSAALDATAPAIGHNQGPEPSPFVAPEPDLLTAQLHEDFRSQIDKAKDVMAGVRRLLRDYATPPWVAVKPDILAIVMPGQDDAVIEESLKDVPTPKAADVAWIGVRAFRFDGRRWAELTDEQLVPLMSRITIADATFAARVTSFGKQIKDINSANEKERVKVKKPWDEAAAAVQGFFKGSLRWDVLTAAVKQLEGRFNAFQNEQIRLERERREAEAKRAREEAEAAAKAAIATEAPDLIDNAIEAGSVAVKAQQAADAPVADLGRVRGTVGGVAAATTVWSWEIQDEGKIPDGYWILDCDRIDREVRALKGNTQIPGIKVSSSIKSSFR